MKNKRLQAIADCVPVGSIVADIGTDHAYLPCELIKSGKALYCYACDINEKPLAMAKLTIESEHMQDCIETILCPGLEKVPQEANVAIIAGMGWMTAEIILENDFKKLNQFDLVLVQVNRDVPYLREWLMHHQFEIMIEKIVFDRFHYCIVGFSSKQPLNYSLSKEELLFGLLLDAKEPECRSYYLSIIEKNNQILARLDSTNQKAKELLWQNEVLEKRLSRAAA